MKKTKFLLVLIFLGITISCGKKENNKENYDSRLNYDQTVGTPENASYIFSTLINTYNQLMER